MHGFPPHFLRNWPLIRTHSHITAQARRYKVFAALTVGSVQRMLLEALQRLFIPQFCIEYQVIVPSGQVEANFNAQQAVDPAPHGGNGIYGGIFVAVCISYAFIEHDIRKILEKGLSYIPEDCEYAYVVRKVMEFYEAHPENWRDCFQYIFIDPTSLRSFFVKCTFRESLLREHRIEHANIRRNIPRLFLKQIVEQLRKCIIQGI